MNKEQALQRIRGISKQMFNYYRDLDGKCIDSPVKDKMASLVGYCELTEKLVDKFPEVGPGMTQEQFLREALAVIELELEALKKFFV